jgi:hypothetical protein
VVLATGQARQADRRGTIRIAKETKVEVLEVYCVQCRRPFEDVEGQSCIAAQSREHLIGGPIGERKKRKTGDAEGQASGPHVAAAV